MGQRGLENGGAGWGEGAGGDSRGRIELLGFDCSVPVDHGLPPCLCTEEHS